jgi:hypothetical protein
VTVTEGEIGEPAGVKVASFNVPDKGSQPVKVEDTVIGLEEAGFR